MFAINRTSRLLLSSVLALALAGCRDQLLPTGVKPVGGLFTQVSSGPVVNDLADPGTGTCDDTECTLREAIAFAAAGATITFAPGLTGTITLTSDYLYIDKNLTITGPGAASLSVSGNNAYLVLWVGGSAAVISGLTFTGGNNPYYGGGIFISDVPGSLALSQCVITGNTATGSNSSGGGIYNGGTLTLTNSIVSGNASPYGGGILNGPAASAMLTNTTVSGNTATQSGGGIRNNGGTVTLSSSTVSGNTANDGGGIYSDQGTATLTNSTVSGNTSYVRGGGVNNYEGTLTLVNSTVAGNTADYAYSSGGGISNQGTLTLTNSLLAGNQATGNYPDLANDAYNPAVVLNSSYSLIGSASGHAIANGVNGNIVGVTAIALNLGVLADNGGPTWTHALLSGSPAIDAGTNTGCPATDQRGTTRPQGTTCDIGAFEKEAGGLPSPNFTFDLSTLPAKTYGTGSFSVDAYATRNGTGTKSFALGTGSVGCSVTSAGMVTITGAATDASYCIIQASLASDGTYSAAGPISQSFHIAKAALTVTAYNETITYGASTPSFFEAYSGFVGDDGLSSLGGTLIRTFAGVSPTSYGPSTTAPTNAGTYSITLSGLSSNDYSFTYIGGTYTINKAAGSVTIANLPASATVGGSFTPTYTKVGDGIASVSSSTPGICSVSAGVVSYIAAGTCTLQASLTVGTNHEAAIGTGQSFTIGSGNVSFSSSCTYTANRKGEQVVNVIWQNAEPGVTLIGISVGGITATKQTGPRTTGAWNRKLPGGAVPTYEMKGGTVRSDVSTTFVAAGTACTPTP